MPARLAAAVLAAAAIAGGLRGGPVVQPVAADVSCPPAAHHAELVVEHSGGGTLSVCVGFSGATISGEALVRESAIEYDMQQFGSYGEAVCQLDNEPQQVPSDCFGSGAYWELFVSRGCGAWHSSSVGVSSLQLADGDLEGFHYVSSSAGGAPPGPTGYCPPIATPEPAASSPPSSTPAPTKAPRASSTPAVRTATPAPTAAATEQPTPSPAATSAVAVLPPDTEAPPAVAVGPLQRAGDAPPPAPSGSSPWAYALGGALLAGLGGSLAWRLRRRRA